MKGKKGEKGGGKLVGKEGEKGEKSKKVIVQMQEDVGGEL